MSPDDLATAQNIILTADASDLSEATIFIIAVPIPIDSHKRPDLSLLLSVSETVECALKKSDIVIYESAVYPGATEEDCAPVLEGVSGLVFNVDFFCGYSPDRISTGDKVHHLTNICKVTSGSIPEVAEVIDSSYAGVITAGTYKAESIRLAAKVIENTQRDLNIALVNELAII